MFNYLNKDASKFVLTIIFFLITLFIINNELVSRIIWWFPELFGDFKTPIKWLECNSLGYNFYENKDVFMECGSETWKSPFDGFGYTSIFD